MEFGEYLDTVKTLEDLIELFDHPFIKKPHLTSDEFFSFVEKCTEVFNTLTDDQKSEFKSRIKNVLDV